ncbi:MAG: hypothetical protein ABR508_08905, partial [Candidatus Baltobacteraceae bacterium]
SASALVAACAVGVACGVACGGGGNAATPVDNSLPPAPTIAPVNTSLLVNGEENVVNGNNAWYTSGTASWSNHAGNTAGAPNGSAPVDGSACTNVSEGSQYPQSDFSQHVFVGIYDNGSEMALPQAVGMVNPQPPTTPAPPDFPSGHPNNNYPVEISTCRYNVHSHDYSGLVHMEDLSVAQSNTTMPAYATLQTLFDVWGAHLGANGITAGSNTLSGRAIVYGGTPSGKSSSGNDLINTYTLFTGAPAALHFSKHMAIWIVIGALPAAGLPEVQIVQTN